MTAGIVSLTLILAALLSIPVSRRLTGDYFSPPAIVIIAWCGTLGLYALRLLPYDAMTPGTIVLIASTIALLVLGSASSIAADRSRYAPHDAAQEAPHEATRATPRDTPHDAARDASPAPSRAPARASSRAELVHPALWTTTYAAIGLAGTAWYVYSVITTLGAQAFRDGEVLRFALNRGLVPGTFLFLQYFSLAAALLAFTLWTLNAIRARHLLLPGLCALGTLITTDRTQSFTLIVTAGFIAAFHLGPRLSAKKLIAGGVLLPALLVVNFIAVGVWRAQSWKMFQTQVSGTATPQPGAQPAPTTQPTAAIWQGPARQLSMLYFYATASYPALDEVRRAERPRTHGVQTFYPIVRALQRLHVIDGPLPAYIPEFLPVAPAAGGGAPLVTNASTFLYYPLEDFGTRGALIYALVIGLASGLAYAWMRRDRDDGSRLLVAGQISTALLLTIFVNKFNNTGWWYVLLLTLAPFILTRRRASTTNR